MKWELNIKSDRWIARYAQGWGFGVEKKKKYNHVLLYPSLFRINLAYTRKGFVRIAQMMERTVYEWIEYCAWIVSYTSTWHNRLALLFGYHKKLSDEVMARMEVNKTCRPLFAYDRLLPREKQRSAMGKKKKKRKKEEKKDLKTRQNSWARRICWREIWRQVSLLGISQPYGRSLYAFTTPGSSHCGSNIKK